MSVTIKSPQEIELMREAGKILAKVHEQLGKELKPGMSTLEVDRLGEEMIRSFGCEPSFKGYQGYPASICVSINEEVVHGIPRADRIIEEGDDLIIPRQDHYEIDSFIDGTIMTLADAPWPGLTPDLISVLIVVATQARGSVLFHQKMFESRLFFVDKLIDMGAQIILCDPHRAVVVGHDHCRQLRAGRMTSPDIRAGIALLIAALSAKGTSRIDNIAQIDRGYEDIENRLNALGAHIQRTNS